MDNEFLSYSYTGAD